MLSKKERKSASRYDFKRIDVRIDDKDYYVLSRYIFSKILTSIGISSRESNLISYELKKQLVDDSKWDIKHEDLVRRIEELLKKKGEGSKMIDRFRMMCRFHQRRIPILVFLFGTGCVGKTKIASKLSEVLNITAVLSTDLMFELNHLGDFETKPMWLTKYESREKFLEDYREQCAITRKGLQGDIKKCFNNGRSVIISGNDMDPSFYGDVIKKYGIRDGVSRNGRGVILPLYIKGNRFNEIYLQRFAIKVGMGSEENLAILRNNFKIIAEYLESLKLEYQMEMFNVDLLNMKESLKKIHKMFISTVEKVEKMTKYSGEIVLEEEEEDVA